MQLPGRRIGRGLESHHSIGIEGRGRIPARRGKDHVHSLEGRQLAVGKGGLALTVGPLR